MSYEVVALSQTNQLARMIAQFLGKTLHVPKVTHFSDGEKQVTLSDAVLWQNKTVVLIQSTSVPVDTNIVTIALAAHALRNAGVVKIFGVIPYFGYSQQNKGTVAATKGGAITIIQMLEAAGIDEFIGVELHAQEMAHWFAKPFHQVRVFDQIVAHAQDNIPDLPHCAVVAPDAGAAERAHEIADRLELQVVVVRKERYGVDKTKVVEITGDCTGTSAIIVDDILQTGGTAINTCNALREAGIGNIYGYFVHPVFAGDAASKIANSQFTKVFVGNTIEPLVELPENVEIFDVALPIIQKIELALQGDPPFIAAQKTTMHEREF